MKAEATTAAAHDLRAVAGTHSGSVLGEPSTSKSHVRALLNRARLAPAPTSPTDERPRWRPASEPTEPTPTFYEPKREPSANYDLRDYDDRRSDFESYGDSSYASSYDERQQPADAYSTRYDYGSDRRNAYDAPPQVWDSAHRFARHAEPPSAAYTHHASPHRVAHSPPQRHSTLHLPPPAAAASYYEHHDPHYHYHQPQPTHYHQPQPPHYRQPQPPHYRQPEHYRQRSPYDHDEYSGRHSSTSAALRRHHNEDDDLDDSDGRVVVHLQEPRSPPSHCHPLKTRRHESSSHRSTSNSSAQSATSIYGEALDDDEYDEHRGRSSAHRDASEDEDFEEDAEDSDEYEFEYERSARADLSTLSPDVYEDNELHSDYRHMLHMLIPANAFGCLVGNRGAIIRKINAQTSCTLSLREGSAFALQDDGEHRVLRIYGKPKGICLAQHLVLDKIRAHRAKKLDPLYTPLTLQSADVLVPLSDASVSTSLAAALTTAPKHKRDASAADASVPRDAAGTAFGPVKWLLRSEDVGKIMGSNGAIMRAIARDTNTKIHVTPTVDMPRGSKERLVTILGPPAAGFEAARAAIERLAGGRAESQAVDSNDAQYFAIPSAVVGALIGPQGKASRWITEQSGVRLQIPQSECLPLGHVNRVLHMQGTRQQVEHAYTLVRAKIRKELERLAIENDDDDDDDVASYVAMKILIPNRVADVMVSQRGRLVQEISAKSGAHAHFLPKHDDELRVCFIAGALASALRAERLILQLVAGDMIATKRSGGVLPREKRKRAAVDDEMVDVDDGDAGRSGRGVTRPTVVRGGRPPRTSDGRRGVAPRRTQSGASANGRHSDRSAGSRARQRVPGGEHARAPRAGGRANEDSPNIMDRLQAPLQSARHVDLTTKRQRR